MHASITAGKNLYRRLIQAIELFEIIIFNWFYTK